MGFITFASGAMGVMFLMFEDVARKGPAPLRHYASMVALISIGLGIIGIARWMCAQRGLHQLRPNLRCKCRLRLALLMF